MNAGGLEGVVDECEGFWWDAGNRKDLGAASDPTQTEGELFFNRPLLIERGDEPSAVKNALPGLCQSDAGRLLFVVFAIRGSLIL